MKKQEKQTAGINCVQIATATLSTSISSRISKHSPPGKELSFVVTSGRRFHGASHIMLYFHQRKCGADRGADGLGRHSVLGESCQPEHWRADCCICLGWTQPWWQWKEEGLTSAAAQLPRGWEDRLPQAVLSGGIRKVMAHWIPQSPPINLFWLLWPREMALHRLTFPKPELQFRSVLLVPGASSDQVWGRIFLQC